MTNEPAYQKHERVSCSWNPFLDTIAEMHSQFNVGGIPIASSVFEKAPVAS